MTAEEIVMGGYAAFGSGDMEALGKIYHPECKTTFHGSNAALSKPTFSKSRWNGSCPLLKHAHYRVD